ncbi:MAG TPA: molybdopterin-synthase adenylyltransferase MoeB [Cyclobacteriaceae bacterium]|nr:molybdopterin-synthase adenylyltransferase MoeB [Cyclobacteriaceae bacterium]
MLEKRELLRYNRQIILPELGLEGQERLKKSSVLVIGAGGLGSPALLYLAAAGIGRIGLIDFDVVDESNLHRQILYNQSDVGKAKAGAAQLHLQKQNPDILIESHHALLTSANAMEIIGPYDVVVDGSDNLPTRYLVNDACVLLKKALVYGAIFRFEGQVSVFNQPDNQGGRGPNYRDLFPEPPPPEMVPSCAEGGVMGVLPGIIGSLQANEVIKILAGMGTTLSGRLLLFDALDFTTRMLKVKSNPDNPISGLKPTIHALIDYEEFCSPGHKENTNTVSEISATEVMNLINGKIPFQLIDVREPSEYIIANIKGINIPIKSLGENLSRINKEGLVVVHCKSGERSKRSIIRLQSEFGFNNLKNMKGGLLAWRKEVDADLPVS